jgi:hypothetical protein
MKFLAGSFKIHNPHSPDQLNQCFCQFSNPHARASTAARSPSPRSGAALAAAEILASFPPDGSSCLNRAREISSRFQADIEAMLMHCVQKAPAFQASALENSRLSPKASSLPLEPSKGTGGSGSPFTPSRGGLSQRFSVGPPIKCGGC